MLNKRRKDRGQYHPVVLWFIHHFRSCIYGFGELLRAPLSTAMTIAVIGVALALPAGLYLLLQNFQTISKPWHSDPSISLYLKLDTSNHDIKKLITQLKQKPMINTVRYISPQEGLVEFKKNAAFDDLLSISETNPLPPVIVITPAKNFQTPTALKNLLAKLKSISAVDIAQLDMTWIKRLYYLISIGDRIFYMLAILFSFGVILIVGNTIRLTTQNHRQEIIILRLVGATNAFIRRPLLYRGLMYGFFGGCFATLLVGLMLWFLESPARLFAQTYDSAFSLNGLSLKAGINILIVSALLGLVGSWIAVQRHLSAPEV